MFKLFSRKSTLSDEIIRRFAPLYNRYKRDMKDFDTYSASERREHVNLKVSQLSHELGMSTAEARAVRTSKNDIREGKIPSLTRFSFPASSGGSTGVPIRLRRSWGQVIYEQATIDHILELRGYVPTKMRVLSMRGDNVKDPADHSSPYWMAVGKRKFLASAHDLNESTLGKYIEFIKWYKPDVIHCHPSTLQLLNRLISASSHKFDATLFVTSSEQLPAGTRKMTSAVLNSSLIDYYGQSERVAFAWSFQDGEYWFRGDYSEVTLSQEDGRFRIVGTAFRNHAMPLLQYDTADFAWISEANGLVSEIELGTAPFIGIEGRQSEFIETADGSRIVGLCQIPSGVDHAFIIQLVQRAPDQVTIRVVQTQAWSDIDERMLLSNARKKIPPSVQIKLEFGETPLLNQAGKAPLFMSEVRQA